MGTSVGTVKAYLTTTNVWYQRGREKLNEKPGRTDWTVSYTHLTLPTKRIV